MPGEIGLRPPFRGVVCRAVKGEDGLGWGDAAGDRGPGKGHGQHASRRPADDYNAVAVSVNIGTSECKVREGVTGPAKGGADVSHWAVDKTEFGTEPVVDTDGEETSSKKELGLAGPDVFAGKHHMATAMDE